MVEEELVAEKRERQAGEVRVRKEIRTEHKEVGVPVTREEIRIGKTARREERRAGADVRREDVKVEKEGDVETRGDRGIDDPRDE